MGALRQHVIECIIIYVRRYERQQLRSGRVRTSFTAPLPHSGSPRSLWPASDRVYAHCIGTGRQPAISPRYDASGAANARGNCAVKFVPFFSDEVTLIVPLCAATISFVI
jgi:hypothetical protein